MPALWRLLIGLRTRSAQLARRLRVRAIGLGMSLGVLGFAPLALASDECSNLNPACWLPNLGEAAFNGVVGTIINALAVILRALAEFCSAMVSLTIPIFEVFINGANNIGNEPTITDLWKVFRDLANALLIIILLVGAVMVILQRASYSVKTILPKLALAVLLVNFSKLLIQLMIDAFHVITVGLYQFASPPSMAGGITESNAIPKLIETLQIPQIIRTIASRTGQTALSNTQLLLSALFVLALMVLILFATVSLLILYAERFFGLALLLMFSPVAMVLGILPIGALKTLSDTFWKKLINYASMSVVIAAHLAMAIIISGSFLKVANKNIENTPGSIKLEEFPSGPKIEWSTLMNTILIIVIVRTAVKAAKDDKFSAGAVDSVQKVGDDWAKKSVTRAPILPTLQRNKDGNLRVGLGSMKQYGTALKEVGKDIGGRIQKSEEKQQQRVSQSVFSLAEKVPIGPGGARLMTKGAAQGIADKERAERDKGIQERVKDITNPADVFKRIEDLSNGTMTDEKAAEIRILLDEKKDVLKGVDNATAGRVMKSVAAANSYHASKKDEDAQKRLAGSVAVIGKSNGLLSVEIDKTTGTLASTTVAGKPQLKRDVLGAIQKPGVSIASLKEMFPDRADLIKIAPLITDDQINSLTRNDAQLAADQGLPDLLAELIRLGRVVDSGTPGPYRYKVAGAVATTPPAGYDTY